MKFLRLKKLILNDLYLQVMLDKSDILIDVIRLGRLDKFETCKALIKFLDYNDLLDDFILKYKLLKYMLD